MTSSTLYPPPEGSQGWVAVSQTIFPSTDWEKLALCLQIVYLKWFNMWPETETETVICGRMSDMSLCHMVSSALPFCPQWCTDAGADMMSCCHSPAAVTQMTASQLFKVWSLTVAAAHGLGAVQHTPHSQFNSSSEIKTVNQGSLDMQCLWPEPCCTDTLRAALSIKNEIIVTLTRK